MKVTIVDCGGGNLQSVKNALDRLGISSTFSSDAVEMASADRVIFPGQGHFGMVMQQLSRKGLTESLRQCALTKPFLGICVGMQLLFDASEEAPDVPGLGIFPGTVRRFSPGRKVPHMGWNSVGTEYFYFAHSYYCEPADSSGVAATTEYGATFPSIMRKGQLWAVQFHPEKSGEVGLEFLKQFVEAP